jgi:hypothetical protein
MYTIQHGPAFRRHFPTHSGGTYFRLSVTLRADGITYVTVVFLSAGVLWYIACHLYWEHAVLVKCDCYFRNILLFSWMNYPVSRYEHPHWQTGSLSPAGLAVCFMLVSCLVCSSTLKMETTCSSKTSVDVHRTIRRYIPEHRTLPSNRCKNLKSMRLDIASSCKMTHIQLSEKHYSVWELRFLRLRILRFRSSGTWCCTFVERHKRFGGNYCLHLKDRMEATGSSETLVLFFTKLEVTISQKTQSCY